MSPQIWSDCLVVAVQSRSELDAALDEAVERLRPAAMAEQAGISVTRMAAGRYEVCLSRDVPPGTTMERWAPRSDEAN